MRSGGGSEGRLHLPLYHASTGGTFASAQRLAAYIIKSKKLKQWLTVVEPNALWQLNTVDEQFDGIINYLSIPNCVNSGPQLPTNCHFDEHNIQPFDNQWLTSIIPHLHQRIDET